MSDQINICWLLGNYHQRKEILDKIKAALGDCSIAVYDNDTSLEYLQINIQELSCFSEKRLIILNEWPAHKGTKAKMAKSILETLNKLPKDCVIVFNNIESLSDDLYKHVVKNGKIFKFDQELEVRQAGVWLKTKFQEANKTISDVEISTLVDSFGKEAKTIDVDLLFILVAKINAFTGSRKVIKADDVFKVCIDSGDFVVWSLFGLLDSKKCCECFQFVYKSMVKEMKTRSFIESLLNLVVWRYRLLLLVKEGLVLENDETKLVEKIQTLNKVKRSGSGLQSRYALDPNKDGSSKPIYSEGMIRSLMRGGYNSRSPVSCYKRAELFKIVEVVEQCMAKIRLGSSDAEVELMLDYLIMLICGKIDYKQITKFWSL